jgi:microcystin-dependent protein
MFAGNFAPAGWAFCNGQLLPISENDALFNLIGTTYGGDGQETFALPNLQSRVPVHQGSFSQIGELAGTESETLTTNQLPNHSHVPQCNTAAGNESGPGGKIFAAAASQLYSNSAPNVALNPAALAPVGGSQPHENMMPFCTVSFIISLFGIFPSQT